MVGGLVGGYLVVVFGIIDDLRFDEDGEDFEVLFVFNVLVFFNLVYDNGFDGYGY